MKQTNDIKIHFCYPETSLATNKESVIDSIVRDVSLNPKIGYAGFEKQSHFKNYLIKRFLENSKETYQKLSVSDYKKIEIVIQKTTKICFEQLPSSTLFVFVFPWLGAKYDKEFGGVNGFAAYTNTVHLFISPEKFSSLSLKETIAHEFNHAVFFHNRHSSSELTLFETFIFEGLAENFREETVGGKSSPWSKAKSEQQCKLDFISLKRYLNSTSQGLYESVFFGGKQYLKIVYPIKKWTGYSIGYNIVKSFRKNHPEKTWEEIMGMKPETIFEMSSFTKK